MNSDLYYENVKLINCLMEITKIIDFIGFKLIEDNDSGRILKRYALYRNEEYYEIYVYTTIIVIYHNSISISANIKNGQARTELENMFKADIRKLKISMI